MTTTSQPHDPTTASKCTTGTCVHTNAPNAREACWRGGDHRESSSNPRLETPDWSNGVVGAPDGIHGCARIGLPYASGNNSSLTPGAAKRPTSLSGGGMCAGGGRGRGSGSGSGGGRGKDACGGRDKDGGGGRGRDGGGAERGNGGGASSESPPTSTNISSSSSSSFPPTLRWLAGGHRADGSDPWE